MFKIQCYNAISDKGLSLFPDQTYQFSSDSPDAIVVRSHNLHDMTVTDELKAIARAGAGTNNIPVEKLKALGVPVFNTPGANANAVKELVIAAMLLASRNLFPAWDMTRSLTGSDIEKQVEQIKKQFSGGELPGKTLGVIGLGAIGLRVANSALTLGMNVIGYDPAISIQNAWQLSADVQQADSLAAMLPTIDFLSIHVPYLEATHHLIDAPLLQALQPHAVVLNFARGAIVDDDAMLHALNEKQIKHYVTDFPNQALIHAQNAICLPHLGASTTEAEENCAEMAVRTLMTFLEQGNIHNSVNYPSISLGIPKQPRLTIANNNIPNMVSQITNTLAKEKLNIVNMINKSRDDIAYTILDIDGQCSQACIQQIKNIEGVLNCRQIIPT